MATYPAPDNRGNPIFNPIQFFTPGTAGQSSSGSAGLTQAEADARYLFLGSTQGASQFQFPIQINKGSTFNQTSAQPIPLTINNLGKTASLTVDAASNANITTNLLGAGLVIKDTVNNVSFNPTSTGLTLSNSVTGAVTGLNCGNIVCTDININNSDLAQLGPTGASQTFLNYNIFQGTNTSGVGTAPLTITNVDTGLYSAVYQDHNNQDQLTILSNTPLGGLTLRNATGNSFTVYPAGVNNAATFINPINVINNLGVTCGSLTLSNAGNTSALTTTATGLNVADTVVTTGNVTSPGFVISDGVDNIYSLYSDNNFGFVVANTTLGGLGTLSLSNGGGSVSTITCTAANALSFGSSSLSTTGAISGSQLTLTSATGSTIITTDAAGLNIPDNVTVSAQTTYTPGASYGSVAATQQFVQLALASQGSGDVTIGGTNNFTGTNTFNTNPPTSTVIQSSLNTTQFATIKYVNGIVSETYPANALSPGEYIGSGGAGTTNTSNVTGSITGNYIGVNTIQVLPTTVTCTASIDPGGDASETITFDLARALAPNTLTSSTLSGLSATITPSSGQMRGCQLIAGFDNLNQTYTLSAFVNQNNYFNGTDTYTISFTGLINYIPL
jgi:hypothetical protein